MSAAAGQKARVVPDLSLSATAEGPPEPRKTLIFGDSVRLDRRRALARAATRLRADMLLPIKTLRHPLWHAPWLGAPARRLLSAAYNGTAALHLPPLRMARNEDEYLAHLRGARMHVTGRFHSVCLSLLTGTPFLALSSNSWKIEALLADAGLDSSRLIALPQLATLDAAATTRPFSVDESARISTFLARAQKDAARLFDDLATLAREARA